MPARTARITRATAAINAPAPARAASIPPAAALPVIHCRGQPVLPARHAGSEVSTATTMSAIGLTPIYATRNGHMVSERYVTRKRRAPPAGCSIPSTTPAIRSAQQAATSAMPGIPRSPCAPCRPNALPALPITQQTTAVRPPRCPVLNVPYSTVTLLARLRGWSTSVPRKFAM